MAGGSALVTWVGAWPGRPEINSTASAVTAKSVKEHGTASMSMGPRMAASESRWKPNRAFES